jgi:hypothetical protein
VPPIAEDKKAIKDMPSLYCNAEKLQGFMDL